MPPRVYDPTERLGINAVERIVISELAWIWREQPINDFGVDGHIEFTYRDKKPNAKLVAVQVKTGPSFFKDEKNGFIPYYIDQSHWDYWNDHSLPVMLVLHNPETNATVWEWVHYYTAVRTGKSWKIEIPSGNFLDIHCRDRLLNLPPDDPQRSRRFRFVMDMLLMADLRGRELFVSFTLVPIEDYRGGKESHELYLVEIRFDNLDTVDAEYEFDWKLQSSDLGLITWTFMPWLEITQFVSVVDDNPRQEIWNYKGKLNRAAEGFLDTEEFFTLTVEPNVLPDGLADSDFTGIGT